MRLSWEVARRAFRRQATYRSATAAGVFTNTVFGFLLAYVLLAVHEERGEVGGFDAVDTVTFVFVVQGLLMVVGIFGDTELAERIRTGDIASDLQRPLDIQSWWASLAYGRAAYQLVFRGLPPFVIGALAFDLSLPSPAHALAFVTSVALAVAVCFGWFFLLQLSAFWLLDVRGPSQIGSLTAAFLSGIWVPLVFFPPELGALARGLPFASMIQLPVEVFLGKHDGADLAGVFALQALWAAVLALAGRAVLARAVRRVVVQGG